MGFLPRLNQVLTDMQNNTFKYPLKIIISITSERTKYSKA